VKTSAQHSRIGFLFLNVGHFLDHYFMLIFATVAAVQLTGEWGLSYSELIAYATPGFIAFAVFAIPAGWLADKWSRTGMMSIFFIGIGLSSFFTSFANSPVHISMGLTGIGLFAAIYHPVGLAMVVQGRTKTGIPLAVNGVFGNMGVACAALITGYLIDTAGWRSAFAASGVFAIGIGILYIGFVRTSNRAATEGTPAAVTKTAESTDWNRSALVKIFGIIFFTTALGGLVFQSTTFALPKVFEERLPDLASTATLVGWYTFLVFFVAAFAQLVVGYLVDHYPIRIVFATVALIQTVFFTLMIQLSGAAALIVAIVFMLAVFGQIPINDVLIGRMVQSQWRSRAYGIRYVVTFSVMASSVPFIAWIHASLGFSALFQLLAFAALLIFIATLFLTTPTSTQRNLPV